MFSRKFSRNCFFMVFFFMFSCGYNPQTDKNLAPDGQPYDSSGGAALNAEQSNQVEVSGYVSPVSISVDGKAYEDGEDFYTQELNRLETIVANEYPGYTFALEADVGVRDLKNGLLVFLVSENDGFADESKVDSKGKFSFYVPKTVVSDNYLIRAYKRIGMRLTPPTKDEKEIYWCYNMYAERTKTLEKASVILRDFTTKITRYKCASSAGTSGLQIPPSQKTSVQEEINDDPSLTPEEIADINSSLDKGTTTKTSTASTTDTTDTTGTTAKGTTAPATPAK